LVFADLEEVKAVSFCIRVSMTKFGDGGSPEASASGLMSIQEKND